MSTDLEPARRLLERLRARGVRVWFDDPDFLLVEPASLLEPVDRAAVSLRREQLLDLLWYEQPDSPTEIGRSWLTQGDTRG